jgi:prolyl-tRNA synthetase
LKLKIEKRKKRITILRTMLESKAFVSINRGTVEDETVLNAQLLIKGGFVEKVMPGIYVYLPLDRKSTRLNSSH